MSVRDIRPPARDPTTSDLRAPSPSLSTTSGSSQKPDFRSLPAETPRLQSATSDSLHFKSYTDVTIDSNVIDTMTCPVCYGTMHTPKILPCLHNICKKCLQQHILTHVKEEIQLDLQPSSFPCPVCERTLEPPDAAVGCEKWASLFPTNHFLHTYGMILAVQREEVDCDPCARRGESTLATWWCRECSEYQCHVCKTVHGGFKIFTNHTVVPVKEIAENPQIAIPKYEPCNFHKEKVTHFCRDHRMPCCSQCLVTSHRKCDHVVTVEKQFKSVTGNHEYERLSQLLTKYEDMVIELVDSRRNIVDDLAVKRREIVEQVNAIRKEFEADLRRLENKLLEDFERFHVLEINKLNAMTTECENLGKQISNAVRLVETIYHSGSESSLINLVEKVSSECQAYEKKLREGQSTLQHVDYDFQVDHALLNVLKTTKSFGNINVKRTKQKSENIVSGAKILRTSAREVSRMRVWIAGDRGRCGVAGGAYFEDGRILVADHDNFKLKLFATTGRLLSKLVLKSKPSDLAMISPDRFIVTFPGAGGVQFIHLANNWLTEGDFVNTNRLYTSLAYSNNRIYLVCTSGISICEPNKCAEVSFIKFKDHGSSLGAPSHIRATESGLVVSDRERHAVDFFTLEGNLLQSYTAKNLLTPAGVELDHHGNVFVCCTQSSNIHHLSEAGEDPRILLSEKDGIENPEIVVFQSVGSKFFVSESKISQRDMIRIFKWR